MPSAYFITASGTDAGKTFVTSLILQYANKQRKDATACKPVLSGTEDTSHDGLTLLRTMPHTTLDDIAPFRFCAPLSPHRAAELEGSTIDMNALTEWCKNWLATHTHQNRLIEGVGGVLVPLSYNTTTLDWMQRLDLPTLFVTGDYLGSLSHSLSALQCLQSTHIDVRAIIINTSENSVEHENMRTTLNALSPYAVPILSLSRSTNPDAPLTQDYLAKNSDFFCFVDSILS